MADDEISSAEDLEELKLIGSGSYGKVILMRNKKNQKKYAVKILAGDAEDIDTEEIKLETDILSDCSCANIINYYGSFCKNRDVWIIMEYIDGGSVSDLIKMTDQGRLPEAPVCVILREATTGLDYLHSHHKIHRDIKGANILVSTNGNVKLVDFGVSKIIDQNKKCNTFIGSPLWMAPEVISANKTYDYKADIWSLGITILEMMNGAPPFHDMKLTTLLKTICSIQIPHNLSDSCSKNLRSLCSACLAIDPSKRPTANQLLKYKSLTTAGSCGLLSEFVVKLKLTPKLDQTSLDELDVDSKQTTSENIPWSFDTIKNTNTIKLNDQNETNCTVRRNANFDSSQDNNFSTMRCNNMNFSIEQEPDDPLAKENSLFLTTLDTLISNYPQYKPCINTLIQNIKGKRLIPAADSVCIEIVNNIEQICVMK